MHSDGMAPATHHWHGWDVASSIRSWHSSRLEARLQLDSGGASCNAEEEEEEEEEWRPRRTRLPPRRCGSSSFGEAEAAEASSDDGRRISAGAQLTIATSRRLETFILSGRRSSKQDDGSVVGWQRPGLSGREGSVKM
jgi:hypothetical protein